MSKVKTDERITGEMLNEKWRVHADHALYRKNGTWYHPLKEFPAALFDENGYVLFETKSEYTSSPYLQIGKQVTVPQGIASMPTYINVGETVLDDEDTNEIEEGSIYPYDWENNELDIREVSFSVFEWLRRLERGQLQTNPEFQRNLVWKPKQKSQFIESVLINIPLPPLYVTQNREGTYILVDGLQRTTTLQEFIEDKFALRDLRVLPELNNKRFAQLSSALRTRIEDKKILVYVLKPSVPLKMVYDIFHRINTGGTQLNRQEIRNCIYIGEATRLLKRLADSSPFEEAIDYGVSSRRMKDQEVVLRYLAFKVFGVSKYEGDMDEFLGNTMKKINIMNEKELQELEVDFLRVMKWTRQFFGQNNFRLPINESRGRINIALLESVSIFFSNQSDQFLRENKTKIKQNYKLLLKDEDYNNAIRLATNDPNRVRTRFQRANKLLGDVVNANSNHIA